jgi:hypothetical protein
MRRCRRHIWECEEAQENTSGWRTRAAFLGVGLRRRVACTSNGHARSEGNHLARAGLVSLPVGREGQEVYHEYGPARRFGISEERGR